MAVRAREVGLVRRSVGSCTSHRKTVNWNGNGKETLRDRWDLGLFLIGFSHSVRKWLVPLALISPSRSKKKPIPKFGNPVDVTSCAPLRCEQRSAVRAHFQSMPILTDDARITQEGGREGGTTATTIVVNADEMMSSVWRARACDAGHNDRQEGRMRMAEMKLWRFGL